MPELNYLLLFILGTALGSFLNVVIFRFDPDKHLFKDVYGRSKCMHCRKVLKWYELVPILSFIVQGGRCRTCRAKLSLQYPLIEGLSGISFVLVTMALNPAGRLAETQYFLMALWLLVFLTLILISVIDFRLRIIPDELNVFLAALGLINALLISGEGLFGSIKQGLYPSVFGSHVMVAGSFLGTSGMVLWITNSPWINYMAGGLLGGLFFGAIYYFSRGKAMGFGDVKMAAAAGFVLGFPDMFVATIIAFMTGAISGLFLIIIKKKKGLKDSLPFGPFIALGIIITFFFGYDIVNGYFRFFNWIFS